MTTWQHVKNYFNAHNCKSYFLRRDYIFSSNASVNVLDTYRCYLQKAGYLRKVDIGLYQKIKKIPYNLSVKQVTNEAYRNGT